MTDLNCPSSPRILVSKAPPAYSDYTLKIRDLSADLFTRAFDEFIGIMESTAPSKRGLDYPSLHEWLRQARRTAPATDAELETFESW